MTNKNSNMFILIGLLLAVSAGVYIYKRHPEIIQDLKAKIFGVQEENSEPTVPPVQQQPTPEIKPQTPDVPPEVPLPAPKSYDEFTKAIKERKVEGFLLFGASWCGYCKQLKDNTLTSPEVKEALSKFIQYEVDTDKEPAIARQYQVRQIPMYFIVDSDGKVIKEGSGSKSVKDFLSWLK